MDNDSLASPTLMSRVPEDMDMEDLDEGRTKFDYTRHVRLYTLVVPFTAVVAFGVATIPLWLSSESRVIRLDEILMAVSLWALSYNVQRLVAKRSPWWQVSAVLRAGTHTLLLLAAPYLLHTAHHAEFPRPSRHDDITFLRTWVLGWTWALVEAGVSIRSAYDAIALYTPRSPHLLDEYEQEDIDDDASIISTNLSLLNTLHKRSELEEALAGVAFVDIPLFILALQRLSAILLSIGMTLVLTATFFPQASIAYGLIAVVGCFVLQALVGLLRAPQVRVYVGLVVGLGVFFAGLGVWGVLE